MDCRTPGLPVPHHILEFTQVHVIESAIPPNHLILCHPLLLCLQSFPASGCFPMSHLFASGGQSIGASASASVLPMSIQGWFPFRLTGLISLVSRGLSRVFSGTRAQKHQFWYKYKQCIFGVIPKKKKCQLFIWNLKLTECLDVYLLNLTPQSPFWAVPRDLRDLSSPSRD